MGFYKESKNDVHPEKVMERNSTTTFAVIPITLHHISTKRTVG